MFTDDRTSQARIRDAALRLFAAHGPGAVTIRDVASEAEVSPALVIRHFTSKDGLRDAVDEHVTDVFETMLTHALTVDSSSPFEQAALPSLAETVLRHLPADSAIPGYLAWMLIGGGEAGSALFARLYDVSVATLAGMVDAGQASAGADPATRAAFLLTNDLAMLMLRPRLTEVLHIDPLSTAGMRRWAAEALSIYRDGITPQTDQ